MGSTPITRLKLLLRPNPVATMQVTLQKRREDDEALVCWLKVLRARRTDCR